MSCNSVVWSVISNSIRSSVVSYQLKTQDQQGIQDLIYCFLVQLYQILFHFSEIKESLLAKLKKHRNNDRHLTIWYLSTKANLHTLLQFTLKIGGFNYLQTNFVWSKQSSLFVLTFKNDWFSASISFYTVRQDFSSFPGIILKNFFM